MAKTGKGEAMLKAIPDPLAGFKGAYLRHGCWGMDAV